MVIVFEENKDNHDRLNPAMESALIKLVKNLLCYQILVTLWKIIEI